MYSSKLRLIQSELLQISLQCLRYVCLLCCAFCNTYGSLYRVLLNKPLQCRLRKLVAGGLFVSGKLESLMFEGVQISVTYNVYIIPQPATHGQQLHQSFSAEELRGLPVRRNSVDLQNEVCINKALYIDRCSWSSCLFFFLLLDYTSDSSIFFIYIMQQKSAGELFCIEI